jgi:serine/threonine-protein kinase
MNDSDSLILELVLRWEEASSEGKQPDLKEICRDYPHLLSAVEQRVAALRSMTPLLSTDSLTDTVDSGEGAGNGREAIGEIRYAGGRLHARGGLGEVLRADDTALNRPVALKRMRDRCRNDAAARKRFIREAEITGQLQHPGVVPVYGFARDQAGDPVYAMRFVEGTTLHNAVGAFHAGGAPDYSALPFRQLLARFVAVCQTIAYAHSRGFIHRDLKPANVMLGGFGETVVLDWGLAKRVGTVDDEGPASGPWPLDNGATRAGQVIGTPGFMSPEQASGDPNLGPASDVFSLGAVLYAVLVGRAPYSSAETEILDRIRRAEYPPAQSVQPHVPKPLEAICRRAMAREPSARYATAQALAEDVERWLAGEVPTVYRENFSERARRWSRRHRLLVNAVAVTILVGGIAAGVGAALLYREQRATAAQRDRADVNYALADETATELVTTLIENPRLKEADFHFARRDLLKRVVPLYEQLVAQRPDDERGRFQQALMHYRLAEVHDELGEKSAALERVTRAHGLLESLSIEHPDRPEYALHAAVCDAKAGQYLYSLGRNVEAETVIKRAHDHLVTRPDDPEAARRLAEANTNYGYVLHALGKFDEAGEHYKAAIAYRHPGPPGDAKHMASEFVRAKAINNYATLLRDQRRHQDSVARQEQAIEAIEALANAHPDYPRFRLQHGFWELNLAILLMDQGVDAPRAEQLARSGVRRIEEIAQRLPAVFEVRKDYPRALGVLANALARVNKTDEADRTRQEAERRMRQLVGEFPDIPAAKAALAELLTYRGYEHFNNNELVAARKVLDEVVLLRDDVLRATPDDYDAVSARRSLHGTLGNLLAAEGKLDAAAVEYQKQLDRYRTARRAAPQEPALIEGEALALMSLGNLASARGEYAGSLPHFRGVLELAEPLLVERGRQQTREIVRNGNWGMADSLVNLKRHADSIPHWAAMVALIRDPKAKAPFRTDHALALARAGRTNEAVAEIDELEAAGLIGMGSRGNAAAVYALASENGGDASTRESLQQKAIRSLRSAQAAGALPATFPNGEDFAALRSRPDFGKLTEELKPPAKK